MEKTKLKLKVSTGKPKFKIKFDGELLLVEVKKSPQKGQANKEIINELKKFFQSEVKILSGFKSREKIIEIYLTKKNILAQIS